MRLHLRAMTHKQPGGCPRWPHRSWRCEAARGFREQKPRSRHERRRHRAGRPGRARPARRACVGRRLRRSAATHHPRFHDSRRPRGQIAAQREQAQRPQPLPAPQRASRATAAWAGHRVTANKSMTREPCPALVVRRAQIFSGSHRSPCAPVKNSAHGAHTRLHCV